MSVFEGKSWDELEVVPHESGRLMFKAELRRRGPKGEIESRPVRVCAPEVKDHVRAKSLARLWFKETEGLDPDRDSEIFDEMESVCLLSLLIREPEAPYSQLMTHDELAEWSQASLKDVQERIKVFESMLDPRTGVATEQQLWDVVARVARDGNLLPLADIVGHEQPSCIAFMARQACLSPTAPSFVQSLGNSIQERSQSAS